MIIRQLSTRVMGLASPIKRSAQSFVQPDFGAEKKRALSGSFLLVFQCLRPKGPQKTLRETLVTSDTRVRVVRALPKEARDHRVPRGTVMSTMSFKRGLLLQVCS